MLMITHLICEPSEKQEWRNKQGNGESMTQEKADFHPQVVPRAPYGAQTNEAECNERSGSWPTVRTEGSAKPNTEEIAKDPRHHQGHDGATRHEQPRTVPMRVETLHPPIDSRQHRAHGLTI